VKENTGYGNNFKEYTVYHPTIEKLFETDKTLPDYVITAHDIDPYFRVKMQGIIQKYVDSSISSTVNLAEDISVDTIANIYMKAYKAGLKGITVYREGSREGILLTNAKETGEETDSLALNKSNGIAKQKEELVTPMPRLRPTMTTGLTRRIRTGEGTLYITINEDENGLCEVFTAIGKAGGNAAAQSEAISRLISLALRSGIDPMAIIKQLKGISGPNPTWEDGRLILSTPDAIGKALNDYLNEKENNKQLSGDTSSSSQFTMASEREIYGEKITDFTYKNIVNCPDCGGPVQHQSGCVTCPSCGFSKCE
jgi:ribonucleoside-diphosphate reductase alpha chain